LLLLGVSLLFASTVLAQHPVATPPPVTKTINTVDEIPTSYYGVGVAEVSYFAGSTSTEVHVELGRYKSKQQQASLFLNSSFTGRQPPPTPDVSFGLRVFGERSMLESLSSFSLETDGESLAIDNVRREGLAFEDSEKQWSRGLHGVLPFALFQKLAASKRVRVRVAELEFELNQKDREALRDMLKALTEPATNSQ